MSLADHVRTLGRGPGRSRSLTQDEAFDAMFQMLDDDAAPEAVDALLMLLRMKGEAASEIAGLVVGAQSACRNVPRTGAVLSGHGCSIAHYGVPGCAVRNAMPPRVSRTRSPMTVPPEKRRPATSLWSVRGPAHAIF